MYNTKYECRYHKDNIFLETDKVNDFEKEIIINILYKEDLINIFDIDENNFDNIDNMEVILTELYNKIKNNNDLKECMIICASQLISENEELGLCILFSFDYMYLTHLCISEYLETSNISEKNIKSLKDKINLNL